MLSCQHITQKASDYIEGRLNFWQRLKFRAHLRACIHCDNFLRRLRLVIGYSSRAGHQCASEAEVQQVLQRIRQAESTGS